jgi:hypothetical protein
MALTPMTLRLDPSSSEELKRPASTWLRSRRLGSWELTLLKRAYRSSRLKRLRRNSRRGLWRRLFRRKCQNQRKSKRKPLKFKLRKKLMKLQNQSQKNRLNLDKKNQNKSHKK